MRTEVAIIGAGPAGLLLSHLLAQDGIESVVVETRSRAYVEARIRAGILEHSTVELLDSVGLGDRLRTEGHQHRGIYLHWPSQRHHLDFVDLVGRSVWVYGQTEVTRDLGRAREAAGQQIVYEVGDTAVHDVRTVSRLYLQVPTDTDIADWSDERIWEQLAARLGHGQDGWTLNPGPITEKSVLAMRSFVTQPMRHGRLFLAGDAAHIVPPTGAKGLNLAVADVSLLAPALTALLRRKDPGPADAYSDTALRRVWRCTHFSWWMTTMLHTSADPFDRQLQLAQLRWVASSQAGATGLAENYAGLPIGF